MTTQSMLAPLPIFIGLDGLPLTGGYVYIGQANLDPREFPVQVFFDAAQSVIASQPMRTTAGYLYRNGSPTNIWLAEGEHSMIVLDSKLRQVFYAPSWTGAKDTTIRSTAVDRFSGTGAPATYTLSVTPESGNAVDVYVGGVYQQKNTYALVDNALTITAAAGTNNVEVVTASLLDFAAVSGTLAAYVSSASDSADAASTSATNAAASASAAAGSATSALASAASAASSEAGAAAIVLGNFTQSGTGAVSRTFLAKARESGGLSFKDFGAIGDGSSHPLSTVYGSLAAAQAVYPHATSLTNELDWAAAQAAVNAAIYNGSTNTALGLKAKVRATAGAYIMNMPLHLGYGTSFTSVFLEGDGPQYAAQTAFSGTSITFTHNNAPGIVVQGSRLPVIRGMTIKGANNDYIVTNGRGTFAGTDADLVASNWVDPALPANSSTRYAVYAGIALDPYSGVRPATSYPDVAYPSFLGAVAQYGKNFSSTLTLEDVHISGFVVGVVTQPCDADGNGDYTKLNRVWINNCQYGLSIGQTQSRLVHLTDCNFANVHTAIVTTKHGRQSGKPAILCESTEFNSLIKWIDAPNLSVGGNPRFVSCYGEQFYSIGIAGANSSSNSTIVFDSCEFGFQLQQQRGVPAYVFQFNGPGHAAFRLCSFTQSPSCHYGMFGQNGAKNYIFEGCLVDLSTISILYEKFSAQATGGISVNTLDTEFLSFSAHPQSRWNLDTGAALSSTIIGQVNSGARSTCLPAATRVVRASSFASDPGVRVVIRTALLSKAAKVFTIAGREVTFDTGLGATPWFISQRGMGVGDIMWDDETGATFRVRSRTTGTITLQAITGYDSAGNLLAAPTATGNFYCLNCRVYSPTNPLMVDTTASGATATNVDQGTGSGAFIDTDLTVNDYIYFQEIGENYVGNENAIQITARDGTARTITVNGSFRRTATFRRLPLFIRAEAPNSP